MYQEQNRSEVSFFVLVPKSEELNASPKLTSENNNHNKIIIYIKWREKSEQSEELLSFFHFFFLTGNLILGTYLPVGTLVNTFFSKTGFSGRMDSSDSSLGRLRNYVCSRF